MNSNEDLINTPQMSRTESFQGHHYFVLLLYEEGAECILNPTDGVNIEKIFILRSVKKSKSFVKTEYLAKCF